MSLNRAAVALGAVVVIGAGIAGFSVYHAADAGKPEPRIYVTAGSTWTPVDATCYNGGDKLSAAQLKTCVTKVQALGSGNKAKPVTVNRNTTFTISVDKDVTKNGWDASTGGSTELVPTTTKYQANNIPVGSVLASSTDQQTGATTTASKGTVLVVERKGSGDVYGVWLFTLQDSTAASAAATS